MAARPRKIRQRSNSPSYEDEARHHPSRDPLTDNSEGSDDEDEQNVQPLVKKIPISQRKVQLQHSSESEDASDAEFDSESVSSTGQHDAFQSKEEEEGDEEEEDSEPEAEDSSLRDISFGALAKAQASFDPSSRKRKRDGGQDAPETTKREREEDDEGRRAAEELKRRLKEPAKAAQKRTSKHAPTVESARKPVSRKRVIFEPSPALKARDPRFDPTVMSGNPDRNAANRANKNYAFLTSYQVQEILDLKSQIKKAKDPATVAQLKRQVMSVEAKVRNAEAAQQESEIRRQHQQKERSALKSGEKTSPYYLKDAEVKKLARQQRLDGMSKRARDKADKRRQKREKGKLAKDMPRVRRA